MKKIISAISTIVLSMGLMAGVASADDCEISNTGPESVNSCEFNEDNFVTIECKNKVRVTNDGSQTAVSGEVVVNENTTAYNGESGPASNLNTVLNELAVGCGDVAEAPTPQGPAPVKPQGQGQADDKAAPANAKKQVAEAPRGGVNAGAGGSTATSIAAIAGLVASIGAVASGAFMFKKFLV